jgi:molybdate transport system substrate-binding protein
MSGRVLINISALTMVGAALLSSTVSVRAVDITFLCPGVLHTTAEELLPEFQRSTGHNVKVIYTSIGYITQRVRNGEAADLAIVSPEQWEDLKSVGKIDQNVRVVIARVGAGVFVKKGAAKPDISSVEAFKRALLNAKSIALVDPAAGGQVASYAPRLFERLGISAELKPKIQLVGGGGGVAPVEPVIKGDAEIGLTTISEIIQFQPAIELVGPFPPEIQIFFGFTGAIPRNARESAAARALLDFFTSPRAISILKSKGLEPG